MVFEDTQLSTEKNGRLAIEHLRRQVSEGRHWADALLEAVGLWDCPQEHYRDRDFTYLLHGEAFDWLLLAERLLMELPWTAPVEEQERLLFAAELPLHVTESQFREALGIEKYRAHLNFFYGVVVEEALILSVEREVLKEGRLRGFVQGRGAEDRVFQSLYGAPYDALLKTYLREQRRRVRKNFNLTDLKCFTYWLFKLRLKHNDGARTASDTRKGLQQLSVLWAQAGRPSLSAPPIDSLEPALLI